MAQGRPRSACGRANAPRLDIGRRNCGRAFPVGWGLAGLGGLPPTVWHGSAAMGGDARGNGFLMDVKTPLVWRLGDGKAAGSFRGMEVGGLRPAAWCNSAAMRTAQRQKWPPYGRYNAPRLEIGRQKIGRGLPGGVGHCSPFLNKVAICLCINSVTKALNVFSVLFILFLIVALVINL